MEEAILAVAKAITTFGLIVSVIGLALVIAISLRK